MVQCRQVRKRLLDVFRQEAGFAFFRAEVDLEQNLLPQSGGCRPSIDLRCQCHAVDRMYQFEDADDGAGFSPLKLADEVPGNALALERFDLRKRLLEAIFTDDLHACINGFSNAVDRDRLGCRHQPNFPLVSSGLVDGLSDSVKHGCEAILDCGLDIHLWLMSRAVACGFRIVPEL
jgi:hypothetical protein